MSDIEVSEQSTNNTSVKRGRGRPKKENGEQERSKKLMANNGNNEDLIKNGSNDVKGKRGRKPRTDLSLNQSISKGGQSSGGKTTGQRRGAKRGRKPKSSTTNKLTNTGNTGKRRGRPKKQSIAENESMNVEDSGSATPSNDEDDD